MTTVVINDRAQTNEEAIRELRKTADLLEGLLEIGGAKVTIIGKLDITVLFEQPKPVEA